MYVDIVFFEGQNEIGPPQARTGLTREDSQWQYVCNCDFQCLPY